MNTMDRTLVDLLERHATERPDTLAYTFLEDGEREVARLDYGDLARRVRTVAAAIQAAGGQGRRALLLYPPGLDFAVGFLGCLAAGAVAVPAYPPASRRHRPRLQSIAQDAEPALALSSTAALPKIERAANDLPGLEQVRWLVTDDLGETDGTTWRHPGVGPDDLAFLQYTSGSTAAPKGVMISHGNLMHNESAIQRSFGTTEASVIVGWLPLYHDMGLIGNVLQPLYLGTRCVLMSQFAFLQQPLRWLRAIDRYRGTVSGGPNFAYDLCVERVTDEDRAQLDLSSWQLAFSGAEPVRASTLDRFARTFADCGFARRAFYPCYGLAEATLMVSGGEPHSTPIVTHVDAEALTRDTIVPLPGGDGLPLVASGLPGGDQDVRIVDPRTHVPCPDGRVGEIWVAGPSVAGGYWRREEATASDFGASLATTDGRPPTGNFLRTGDLGFAKDGQIYVTGRLKDMIIIRGRNHYPQDIELTAEASHPSLRPSCGAAFSVEVDDEERLVVVHEVDRHLKDEPSVIAEALAQAVAEAHELQVHHVVLVRTATIAKTSSGKIQRRATRAAYLEGALARIEGAKRTKRATEKAVPAPTAADVPIDAATLRTQDVATRTKTIAAFLRQRFARISKQGEASIATDRPLTALGLDSLAAVELKHAVTKVLAVDLPLEALLEGMTLDELAGEAARLLDRPEVAGGVTAGDDDPERPTINDGQRALWYLHRLAPTSGAYNIGGAAWVRGSLDTGRLGRALAQLQLRHPALRTVFPAVDGNPQARADDVPTLTVETEDAQGRDDASLLQRAGALLEQPFDLERGPLLRMVVLQDSDDRHLLVLALHHIVADMWSLGVLIDELARCYAALDSATGEPLELPLLQHTPGDVARWRQQSLDDPSNTALGDFWRRQLDGELPVLDLPADHPRANVQTFDGGSVRRTFDSALGTALSTLAKEQRTTLFTVAMAAFQTLLHRLSGQEDVIVGTPTAGRDRPETADLVSYFVNPVVIRSAAHGDTPFDTFLGQVRRTALDAFAHQAYPFPRLVEDLGAGNDPSRSPVFQAMLVLHQDRPGQPPLAGMAAGAGDASMPFADLVCQAAPITRRSAQFDVTLELAERSGQLDAQLVYNRSLFEPATAARMLDAFGTLLRAIVDRPTTPIAELPLVDEATWQRTTATFNPPVSDGVGRCLHEWVADQAQRSPERVALVDGEARFTYRQLDHAANRLAHHLRHNGVEGETPVGLCVPRSARMVVGVLGVLKAGGCYVPLDPAYPADRLAFTLEDSAVPVLLLDGEPPTQLPATRATRIDLAAFDPGADRHGATAMAPPAIHTDPDQIAYVIYTSGSTGRPKGVAISHRSAATLLDWAGGHFPGETLNGVLAATSVCFDLSIYELFVPLAHGGRVILAENALALPTLPARDEVTLINTVPSAAAELVTDGKHLPPSVEVINLAGEPLVRSLVDRLYGASDARVVNNLYGPSEDTTYSTWAPAQRDTTSEPTIGRPVDATQAYVVDARLRPVPIGVPGELLLGGAGLARGYLGRAGLTASRFVPDPFGTTPGGRLYRTGDLVRYRPDGELIFLGRLDHQVKIRGFRIELGEIENALGQHDTVAESVVVAHAADGTDGGERQLVAYVVGAKPDIQALRAHLGERLPAFMVPQAIVPLDHMPRTPNGKIDRKALPAPDPTTVVASADFVAPQTEVEEMLAAIWCEVLDIERVGIYDSFFELGGHSLLATRILARVQEAFDVELPVRALLESPTIHGLAEAIFHALLAEADDETAAAVMAEMK